MVISTRCRPLAAPTVAELNPGVPQRVRPWPHDPLHLIRPGVGGKVEVGAQAAQDRVADAAAHQVQIAAGVGEHLTEAAERVRVPVQRDQGTGQQFGVGSGIGHVRLP